MRVDSLFSATAAKLADFLEMGKPGKTPGPRELIPHESYRPAYQIGRDSAWILALVHTARMWPPLQQ